LSLDRELPNKERFWENLPFLKNQKQYGKRENKSASKEGLQHLTTIHPRNKDIGLGGGKKKRVKGAHGKGEKKKKKAKFPCVLDLRRTWGG